MTEHCYAEINPFRVPERKRRVAAMALLEALGELRISHDVQIRWLERVPEWSPRRTLSSRVDLFGIALNAASIGLRADIDCDEERLRQIVRHEARHVHQLSRGISPANLSREQLAAFESEARQFEVKEEVYGNLRLGECVFRCR